jgi:hypothetical protein
MRTAATLGVPSPKRRGARTGERRVCGRGSDGNRERGSPSCRSALVRAVWREPIRSGASGHRRHHCWDPALAVDHEDGGGQKVTPRIVSMCADRPRDGDCEHAWGGDYEQRSTPRRGLRACMGRGLRAEIDPETEATSKEKEGATSREGERAASKNGLGSVEDRVLADTPFSRSVPDWPAGSIPSRPSLRASPRQRAATHPIRQDRAGPGGR